AYSIAGNNSSLFSTLLACGADPNTVLPSQSDKDFLAMLSSKGLRSYVEEDRNSTVAMLGAGLGQDDYLRGLIDAGANRSRLTSRNKMSALDIAAETGHWRAAQILLGGGPSPDRLRLEISLGLQRVALFKNGVPVFRTQCSTGRPGYSTKRGEFVITNKERYHRSTIYHVDMPYFMRLSCLDFGMHAGYVPNYPASHGCIRLPEDAARKFFSEIPVGTKISSATLVGLLISLFAMVVIRYAFAFFVPEIAFASAILKETLIWASAAALLVIIRRGERLSLRSIGLGTCRWWKSIAWGLVIAIVSAGVVGGLAYLTGYGHGPGSAAFEKLPLWLITLIVLRAGVV